jgi:hypothetical protein
MENILRNSKQDWFYIILSTLSGFLMVGFFFVLKDIFQLNEYLAVLISLLIYSVFFDIRHFFSTYSRTFLDKEFLRENKSWLYTSTLFIFILPMLIYGLLIQGKWMDYESTLFVIFARRLVLILGFYHLVKQNWGFVAIYKKKFNEPQDGSDRWDKLLLLSGSFIAFVYAAKTELIWFPNENLLFTPEVHLDSFIQSFWNKIAVALGLISFILFFVGFRNKTKPQFKFVSRNLAYFFSAVLMQLISKFGYIAVLDAILVILIILFLLSCFLAIQKAVQFGKLNIRKWAVLLSSLLLYNLILIIPVENKAILIMGITIPHNIQYLKFVSFFSEKQYKNSTKDHGLARRLSHHLLLFFTVSLLFASLFEIGRTGTEFFASPNAFVLKNTIAIFFLSFLLHHYYLDAVIWRVRKDENLSNTI